MAEIYIIDGYNLMYRLSEVSGKPPSREQVLELFIKFRPQGRNKVIVVFDGYGQGSSQRGKISVIYSKSRSADEYILKLIEDKKQENVRVVSDDRELLRKAKLLGAGVVGSGEFLKASIGKKNRLRHIHQAYEKPSLLSTQALEIRKELEKVWLQRKKK